MIHSDRRQNSVSDSLWFSQGSCYPRLAAHRVMWLLRYLKDHNTTAKIRAWAWPIQLNLHKVPVICVANLCIQNDLIGGSAQELRWGGCGHLVLRRDPFWTSCGLPAISRPQPDKLVQKGKHKLLHLVPPFTLLNFADWRFPYWQLFSW